MLQDQETFDRSQATWTTKYVKTPKKVVNTIRKTTPFTFLECEELGTSQPRRCGICANCNRCSVRAQELTSKEQEELGQIKANLTLDPETKVLSLHYPLISDPRKLTDKKGQAVAIIK